MNETFVMPTLLFAFKNLGIYLQQSSQHRTGARTDSVVLIMENISVSRMTDHLQTILNCAAEPITLTHSRFQLSLIKET